MSNNEGYRLVSPDLADFRWKVSVLALQLKKQASRKHQGQEVSPTLVNPATEQRHAMKVEIWISADKEIEFDS